MAFPTYVGAGALVETTTTLTVNAHTAHASGDYELLVLETQDQAVTLTTAAGFTQHPGSPVSAPSGTATLATRLVVYERIWNGTDGSPVTDDPGNHVIGTIFSFRRSSGTWSTLAGARSATQGTGWQSSHEEVDDTSGAFPGITTDTADQLIIGITAHAKPDIAGGTAEMSAITNSNLATITERFDDAAASGNGGWIGLFTGEEATSGQAIGDTTYTKATVSYKAHLTIGIRDTAPAAAFAITAESAAFTVTGLAALVVSSRQIPADPGVYTLTGILADGIIGRVVLADPAAYTLTGLGAGLIADHVLPLDVGSYVFTGFAADAVSGGSGFSLNVDPGVYVVTGVAAALIADHAVLADPGSLTMTGLAAGVIADRLLNADFTAFTITGVSAPVIADRVVFADPGSYVLTGVLTTVVAGRVISAVPAAFAISGATAALIYSGAAASPARLRTLLGVGL